MKRPSYYFLKNKEWYYFDIEKCCYKLKPDAPQKAKESYKEYCDDLKRANTPKEDGYIYEY